MNYEVKIRGNMTCPSKDAVVALIADGKTSFRSVVGRDRIRGKIPVYIDEIKPENLYGFLSSVTEAGASTDCSDEEIDGLVKKSPELYSYSVKGTIISAEFELSEEKIADIKHTISPELQSIADAKIADGILTQEEFEARWAVMDTNRVPEPLKKQIVSGYRKYNKPIHSPSCIYVDPYLDKMKENEEGIVSEGLRNGINRMATICEGEKSVGKNVYMETIAWLLGMPLYMIGFSRNMNPASIYGEKSTDNSASEALRTMTREAKAKVMLDAGLVRPDDRIKAIDAAASYELQKARAASVSIVIDQSELYDWLIDGGVMVFNEMNMAESNFFSSFTNPLTDGTGFLFIPGRGEVKMHDDCVLFGTQNADYEGVMQQNEATMSRFNTLYFKQPESVKGQFVTAVNAALTKAHCTYVLDDKYYNQAQAFYTQCLKSVRSGIVSNAVLNIRGFVRALTTVAKSEGYCQLSRWLQICVVNTCPTDERGPLMTILQSVVTL